jgi:acetoin utilization deacetylase AcuC-like enzyme
MAAVDAVWRGEVANAYVLTRPPGHHCLPDAAMGFCFLSNIAVAIEAAKARYGIERVAVLDWDVHHGNGTQAIYYQRPDVLTMSIHQDGCFPPGYNGSEDRGAGAGLGANINIPLLPGSGHDAYLYAMQRMVLPALARYQPQLIIVACGYDANAVDPLARMQAHSDTFRQMTTLLRNFAEQHCEASWYWPMKAATPKPMYRSAAWPPSRPCPACAAKWSTRCWTSSASNNPAQPCCNCSASCWMTWLRCTTCKPDSALPHA